MHHIKYQVKREARKIATRAQHSWFETLKVTPNYITVHYEYSIPLV